MIKLTIKQHYLALNIIFIEGGGGQIHSQQGTDVPGGAPLGSSGREETCCPRLVYALEKKEEGGSRLS